VPPENLFGAVVVPNLDRDDRALPEKVTATKAIVLDVDEPKRPRPDDEIAKLLVRTKKAMPAGECRLFLSLNGTRKAIFRVVDDARKPIPEDSGLRLVPIPTPKTKATFGLEVTTLAGAPKRETDYGKSEPGRLYDERDLYLKLICRAPHGGVVELDRGKFTAAPLILFDDASPAERLYIAVLPENGPSVRDVTAALPGGVKLIPVPADVSHGDAWLQDQFAVGYCEGPTSTIRMLVHLPRSRANVVRTKSGENLAGFVRGHFPAKNIGLCDDFWKRALPVTDAAGVAHMLEFGDSEPVLLELSTIFQLLRQVIDELTHLLSGKLELPARVRSDLGVARAELPKLGVRLLEELRALARRAKDDAEKGRLEARAAALQTEAKGVIGKLAMVRKGVYRMSLAGTAIEITGDELTRLHGRLQQMHDGVNYGGNIRVMPPSKDAKLGKIVLGNTQNVLGDELVDPELLRLLRSQRVQPIVQIETWWLHVGHADEIVAFVPHKGKPEFSIARASGTLALAILKEADAQYVNGLQIVDPKRRLDSVARTMSDGTSPVTFLLRGKRWLHEHPKGAFTALEPPLIYRRLAGRLGAFSLEAPYTPGEGDNRHYPARISLREIIAGEDGTNREIDDQFLDYLDEVLRNAAPEAAIVELPVLFDAIPERATTLAEQRAGLGKTFKDFNDFTTSAFTPDIVNMQVLGSRLLVPRPYGPRMKMVDALAVTRRVLQQRGHEALAKKVDEKLFKALKLEGAIHWAHAELPDGRLGTARDIAEEFKDGFPGLSVDAIAKKIITKNGAAFKPGGDLKPNWHKLVIPEETIDLFEAYTSVALLPTGAAIHWVDSWFYHLRLGEIHCGTNVLRSKAKDRPKWWNLPEAIDLQDRVTISRRPTAARGGV
jgi:hypothetical protein